MVIFVCDVRAMMEMDVIDIGLSPFSRLWGFMDCYYDWDIHFGMDDSFRFYIEMDNEPLCGCDILSYAPLFHFGDFHDYDLWEYFLYYLDYFEWSIREGYLGV